MHKMKKSTRCTSETILLSYGKFNCQAQVTKQGQYYELQRVPDSFKLFHTKKIRHTLYVEMKKKRREKKLHYIKLWTERKTYPKNLNCSRGVGN